MHPLIISNNSLEFFVTLYLYIKSFIQPIFLIFYKKYTFHIVRLKFSFIFLCNFYFLNCLIHKKYVNRLIRTNQFFKMTRAIFRQSIHQSLYPPTLPWDIFKGYPVVLDKDKAKRSSRARLASSWEKYQ